MTSSNYNGLEKLISKVLIFCTYLMTWNKKSVLVCPGSNKAERIYEKPDVVDNEYFSWFYDISYHS